MRRTVSRGAPQYDDRPGTAGTGATVLRRTPVAVACAVALWQPALADADITYTDNGGI